MDPDVCSIFGMVQFHLERFGPVVIQDPSDPKKNSIEILWAVCCDVYYSAILYDYGSVLSTVSVPIDGQVCIREKILMKNGWIIVPVRLFEYLMPLC